MDTDDAVRLRRAVMRLARTLNASSTDEGLTPSQASALGVVVARGPIALSEIARIENLHPTMASRIVGALASAELIERRPDPDDLRNATARATRKGRAVHERIKRQRAAVIAAAAEGLDPAEQDALLAALPVLERLAEGTTGSQ